MNTETRTDLSVPIESERQGGRAKSLRSVMPVGTGASTGVRPVRSRRREERNEDDDDDGMGESGSECDHPGVEAANRRQLHWSGGRLTAGTLIVPVG